MSVTNRVPLVRKMLYSGAAFALLLLFVELGLHLLYGAVELRKRYEWWVDTHLVDISYPDFVRRQERIRETRKRLGMERGQTHPVFGWTYNPTFRIDDAEIQIHINSLALRGEDFSEEKVPGEIRIMCLGGSTTAGEEVGESQTYPAQLEALLREHYPGRNIRVINAGVPSYDLRRSFLHYALVRYRYEPDFVTIYHGMNDLFYHTDGGLKILPKHNYSGSLLQPFVYQGDAEERFWRDLARPFLRHSYLLMLTRAWIEPLIDASDRLEAPDAAGIETFAGYYRALVREVRGSGATPIPMTFAISYPGNFSDAERKKIEKSFAVWLAGQHIPIEVGKQIVDLQNRSIIELSRDQGLAVADVASAVPPDRRHFLDVCHFTSAGNQSIAETLASTIIPMIDRKGL